MDNLDKLKLEAQTQNHVLEALTERQTPIQKVYNPDATRYLDDMKRAEKLLLQAQTILDQYDNTKRGVDDALTDLDYFIDLEKDRLDMAGRVNEDRSDETDNRSV